MTNITQSKSSFLIWLPKLKETTDNTDLAALNTNLQTNYLNLQTLEYLKLSLYFDLAIKTSLTESKYFNFRLHVFIYWINSKENDYKIKGLYRRVQLEWQSVKLHLFKLEICWKALTAFSEQSRFSLRKGTFGNL